MKELEVKTYNFAVQSIGFAKSIEKHFPEIEITEFKKSAGAVSIKYIEAFDCQENEDFANKLRECHSNLKSSLSYLNSMTEVSNESLEKEKAKLLEEATLVDKKLEKVIKKLIY